MEFRKTDIPSFVAGLKAAQRGNGAGGLHVVPAVEHTMLSVALSKKAETEELLTAIRSEAKQAAKRAGVPIRGLFEDGKYVPRANADRRYSEGIEEGKAQRTREIVDGLNSEKIILNSPPPPAPGPIGMLRRRRDAGIPDGVTLTLKQGLASMAGTFVAADDVDAVEAEAAARVAAEAKVKAEAILAAAALRDAGGPPLPKPGPRAQRILDAAKKAHRKRD